MRLSNFAASEGIDAAIGDLLDNGYIRIYNGTIPGTVDTAVSSQTMLVEARWASAAFASAVNGSCITSTINSASAAATGNATWFRLLRNVGTTAIADGSVGTAGADMNLNSVSITANVLVTFNAAIFTLPKV